MAQVRTASLEALALSARTRLRVAARVSLALFALLLVPVWHERGATALDRAVGGMAPLQVWRAQVGDLTRLVPLMVFTVTGALLLLAWARRDWFAVALCAAGPALAGLVAEVVKPLVDREISTPPALSYPSGHTTLAAALAALAVLLTYRSRGAKAATIAAAPAATLSLLVAFAVVRLGWHYPTDAIGGVALGIAAVLWSGLGLSAVWPEKSDELVKAD